MSSQQSLLTKAELAFIRQLNRAPEGEAGEVASERLQLVEIGEQLTELFARYAAEEKLTLHAHLANQHLTFDLHIHQDEQNQPSLQLGAPQIYDQGDIQRPWRSKLNTPLPLRKKDHSTTGLLIHELSMNSALVECITTRPAPKRFQQYIEVEGYPPIAVAGELVRTTDEGFAAYWMHACDPLSDEHLRQFIYQQHLKTKAPGKQPHR
ncbi:hypothetical protein WG219_15595 [Ectopseudomonas mendocina]|uniref:PilZ domain-containing protein n=1 Tax=Ectopseudomonas mendocina TaxID=300 RepID=A0ABZ2RGI2_ECTME